MGKAIEKIVPNFVTLHAHEQEAILAAEAQGSTYFPQDSPERTIHPSVRVLAEEWLVREAFHIVIAARKIDADHAALEVHAQPEQQAHAGDPERVKALNNAIHQEDLD